MCRRKTPNLFWRGVGMGIGKPNDISVQDRRHEAIAFARCDASRGWQACGVSILMVGNRCGGVVSDACLRTDADGGTVGVSIGSGRCQRWVWRDHGWDAESWGQFRGWNRWRRRIR